MHYTETNPDPKFTPAPWHHHFPDDSFVECCGRRVCKRPPLPECTDQQWAHNAALIAKAPELYRFIEAHLELLPDHLGEDALNLLAEARGHSVS